MPRIQRNTLNNPTSSGKAATKGKGKGKAQAEGKGKATEANREMLDAAIEGEEGRKTQQATQPQPSHLAAGDTTSEEGRAVEIPPVENGVPQGTN